VKWQDEPQVTRRNSAQIRYSDPLRELVHRNASIQRRRAHCEVRVPRQPPQRVPLCPVATSPSIQIAVEETFDDEASDGKGKLERRRPTDRIELSDGPLDDVLVDRARHVRQ
jgi:hypothetical protein